MRLIARAGLAVAFATTLACHAGAFAQSPDGGAATLVPFDSDEGLARFVRADAKVNFPALANQFEAQSNAAFCGPTTATIVLNTVRGRSKDLPHDRTRLRPEDLKYIPNGFDPTLPRFTQDNVIGTGQKPRSQVLGEPVTINGKVVRDFGYQVRQLDELFRANGLTTHLVIVDDTRTEDTIRADLVGNLRQRGSYAVVNYRREAVGQQGGAHISPLGAYDSASDSFLVLDVNPTSASWVWMPTASLVHGMRTFDTVENRGYILISPH